MNATKYEHVDSVTRELQRQIEQLREILLSDDDPGPARPCSVCTRTDCPVKAKYRQTILEVIDVLEQTKKAFKSKRLGVMREKLIRELAECE